MKRFLLFAFDTYYPNGGWDDFKGSFDTVEEATTQGAKNDEDNVLGNYHVIDSTTGEMVYEWRYKRTIDTTGYQFSMAQMPPIQMR